MLAFFKEIQCDLKIICYLTYIQLIIEYGVIVRPPLTQSNIQALKMIQWKEARFVFNNYATLSSVTTIIMLEHEFIGEAM